MIDVRDKRLVWHVTRYEKDSNTFCRGSGYRNYSRALAEFRRHALQDDVETNYRWSLEVTREPDKA